MNADEPEYDEPVRRILPVLPSLIILGGLVYVALHYHELGEQVPLHFDVQGRSDGYGPRQMLFALPVFALVLEALMALFAAHPQWGNYPVKVTDANRAGLYALYRRLMMLTRLCIAGLMTGITACSVEAAAGRLAGLPVWGVYGFVAVMVGGSLVFIVMMRGLKDSNPTA